MDRFIIYGMIEPKTRKIVYIDFYIDENNDYIEMDDKEFLDYTLEQMYDEENPYVNDLRNMWNESIGYCEVGTKVVVLEVLNKDGELVEKTNSYRKLFKPKFNAWLYGEI